MALPASGYLGNSARTTAEFQTAIEDLRDYVAGEFYASDGETQTGTSTTKAVTPASLSARTATETRTGVIELATTAEVQTGTDTARAVTPAGLAACTATEARAGVVELATSAEAIAGSDTARAVTPAGLSAAMRPTTVAGHVRAGNTQIYNGATSYPNGDDFFYPLMAVAEDTWVTVGPTGSGATITWTALDNLPSTARVLIVNIHMQINSDHATNDQTLTIFGAAGGVTGNTSSVARIGYLTADDFAVSAEVSTLTQQYIPLSSSRVFQYRWSSSSSSSDATVFYKGFITD